MKKFEKWLYLNDHQDTHGQWSRLYYAMFKPWNGTKTKTWPLGDNLDLARAKLKRLRDLNAARVEVILDEERERREALAQQQSKKKGISLGEWARHYFDVLAPSFEKRGGTLEREKRLWDKLESHFGPKSLGEIKLTAISEYRIRREKEVSFVTANRELAFVRYLLNRAMEDGALEVAPRIRLKSEKGRARARTVSPDEYGAILANMGRTQQRYLIALYETAMRRDEPLKLTWDKVDFKKGLIRLALTMSKRSIRVERP